jgi:hypothetical protein
VETGQILVPELLATLITDQRLGLAGFELCNLRLCICVFLPVIFVGFFGFLDLLQSLVLVIF